MTEIVPLRPTVCRACRLVNDVVHESSVRQLCRRCRGALRHRKPRSLETSSACLLAAIVLFVPANVYPIMTIVELGDAQSDTIASGIVRLIESDMWPLALIVFVASIVVPILKILGISYLLVATHRKSQARLVARTKLYRAIESVGRWSMVDIFVVAILIAVVRLERIAIIEPEIGAMAFASVVVLTMVASHQFDPRIMWDHAESRMDKTERTIE